ncbi:MAG TPA: hydrogenase 4 subunit B [Candidatus Aquicultor sp.]
MAEAFNIVVFAAYLIGAVLPLAFYKNNRINIPIAYTFSLIASTAGIAASLVALVSMTVTKIELFSSPIFGVVSVSLDSLSAFFLLTVSVVSFAVSIYAPPYMTKTAGKRSAGGFGALYNLFLLSLVLVVSIDNAFYFLVFWELMTLTSYFLVVFHYKQRETARAGYQYLVMTHVGTAFILFSFLALSVHSGSFSFAGFKEAQASLPMGLKNVIFISALLGFSTKAGLVPLHVWLPRAHPAAPSHVSALMSSVMIKTGIYGLIRVLFDFLSPAPWWWGLLVLILAVVSAVLGVMYALMEHDIKRLLAYHSVENVGIIMIGVGFAVIFSSLGFKTAALLSLTAGLFHLINHAIFKGLLFLTAGSIQYATGTKNIEDLGGLIKRMPITAALFLVGSLAISAIPPFNGFASEWLLFQSILQANLIGDVSLRIISLLSVPALALTGGLAAACFVKAFGITFLSIPRSARATDAKEVPAPMLIGMSILGLLCLILGIGAAAFIKIPWRVAESFIGKTYEMPAFNTLLLRLPDKLGHASASLSMVAVLLVISAMLSILLIRLRGRRSVIKGPTWDCGIPEITPRMQYSATAFTKPLRTVFSAIYQPRRQIEVDHEASPYFSHALSYEASLYPVFERQLYRRFINTLVRVARRARVIQAGNINLYLAYIFATLVGLLVFVWR